MSYSDLIMTLEAMCTSLATEACKTRGNQFSNQIERHYGLQEFRVLLTYLNASSREVQLDWNPLLPDLKQVGDLNDANQAYKTIPLALRVGLRWLRAAGYAKHAARVIKEAELSNVLSEELTRFAIAVEVVLQALEQEVQSLGLQGRVSQLLRDASTLLFMLEIACRTIYNLLNMPGEHVSEQVNAATLERFGRESISPLVERCLERLSCVTDGSSSSDQSTLFNDLKMTLLVQAL